MSLSSSYKDEFILNKSKKYLFIKNNLHTNDLSFIKTVDNDFKNIFGENLHIKNSLLEFENDRFISKSGVGWKFAVPCDQHGRILEDE